MADGCHLEQIENGPYLRNNFTNRHEICHGDAYWVSEPDRKLKFRTFKNRSWRTAAILENRKTAISQQMFDRRARNLAR